MKNEETNPRRDSVKNHWPAPSRWAREWSLQGPDYPL
jgi:hypothetical protein